MPALLAALAGGAVTAFTAKTLDEGQTRDAFVRTNHAGEPVSLSEGTGVAVSCATTALLVRDDPALLAACAAGALGALDDHREDTSAKGLKGHLQALSRGQLTTGGAKLLGISAAALVAATMIARERDGGARVVDVATDAALIAGGANLMNLFDLRPGRALKVGALLTALGASRRSHAAGLAGAIVAALPGDLKGRTMLGDTGANALGASIGALLARLPSRSARLTLAASFVGLILASEKVSFSAVIDANPALAAIDMWGRS